MKPPKIYVLDIETAPINAHVWGLWDQNVGIDQIDTDWTILAYAFKELGKSRVAYADAGGRGAANVRKDHALLKGLWDVLNDADIIVGHNARKFDLKKINARLIESGFPPYSPVRVIDTLTAAKSAFAFSSNKLEHLAARLTDSPKSKHKKFPGFELWAECLKDNAEAWAEMQRYNKRDVIATEQLYIKLRPWITNHPNLGAYMPTTQHHVCPKCGSHDTKQNGTRITQQGRYHRYQCNDCGGYSRGKELVVSKAERMKMLVPQ